MTDNPSPSDIRQEDVREALALAIRHIEHMAAFITEANSDYHCGTYSFESLGEDLPGIRAALSAQTGEPVAWRIRVREGSMTYNTYTERLPFEPLTNSGIAVLGEPQPLYASPPPQPDTAPSLTLAEQAIERQRVLGDPLSHVDAPATELVNAGESEYTAPSPLSTGEVRQIAGWQPSKYTDGPNESGYFTAGIDIPMEKYGKPDTHCHAIEFHAEDQTTAEARRDLVIVALSHPPATEQIRREALEEPVADQIIGAIEERFPNWRSYRDLIDCIDCTLHELREKRSMSDPRGLTLTTARALASTEQIRREVMSDVEIAAWGRDWHWADTAENKPTDPSIYFRDTRMLKAFAAALAARWL